MAAEGGIFCTVRQPRNYQKRLKLSDMADTDIIERFQLSRRRINWLVERFRDLERDCKKLSSLHEDSGKTF